MSAFCACRGMAASGAAASMLPQPQRPSAASPHKQVSGRVPVDRGWAWMVLAAACITFGMPSGSALVTGIVVLELFDRFDSHSQMTLWMFILPSLVTLLRGPLASLLLQKTSHRCAIIVAGVLAAGGTIVAGYAPDIELNFTELTFATYILVNGFVVALLHVASLTCTAAYFDRHRGLAVGLTTAGGGVMSFILPQVALELFEQFSFEGALLVYGGIFLHLFVCALLIRPVTSYQPVPSGGEVEKAAAGENCGNVCQVPHKGSEVGYLPNHRALIPLDSSVDTGVVDLDMPSMRHQPFPQDTNECSPQNGSAEQQIKVKSRFGTPAALKSGSIKHHFGLLKNERMWMMCIINVLASNAFVIIFKALPPYGESIGVSRQRTSTLLAIGTAAEIVCRALHGWLSDRKFISPLLQLSICSGLMGLVTLVCPIVDGALGVALTASACGIVGTSIFTLSTVCIRDLLGTENMTSALGIEMSSQAISYVVSPFLMGYLTTPTGRWDGVFYYMGSNLIATSLFAAACCVRLRRSDLQKRSNPSPLF